MMAETIIDILENNRKQIGDKTALFYKEQVFTYEQLKEQIDIIAGFLKTCGVKKADTVILEAVSKPEYVMIYLAVIMTGAIPAPVERGITDEKLKYISNLIGASFYFSIRNREDETMFCKSYDEIIKDAKEWKYNAEYERLNDDDITEIIFTSGTTGKPKAAMHSVKGIESNIKNTYMGVGIEQSDIILLPLPLNHSFGLRVLRSAFKAGASVVLQNGAIGAKEIYKNVQKYKCTALVCVSATLEAALESEGEKQLTEGLSSLRYIEVSAGAIPIWMRKKLIKLLPDTRIKNTWGSTETGGCLFLDLNADPDKIESVGKAGPGIQIAVYSDECQDIISGCGKKNSGRLALRGDMLFVNYWNQDYLHSQQILKNWYVTNDIVWQDEDGFFYMIGRNDFIINMGGEKVSPKEIEEKAVKNQKIRECACIGVKDEKGILGEVPVLFVVCDVSDIKADHEKIRQELVKGYDSFKCPREFIFVERIPKGTMEKTDYKLLKSMYEKKNYDGLIDEIPKPDINNEVIQTILRRRSRRKFKNVNIEKEIIEKLLAVAKSAPSGKNLQTRRFTVLNKTEDIKRLKNVIAKVAEKEKTSFNGFNNPPLIIMISNDRRNKDGIQDVGCSAENIMIAAESLGMASVWLNPLMEISDHKDIRPLLDEYKIPKNHIVWACMAIGWPDEEIPQFPKRKNEVVYVGE